MVQLSPDPPVVTSARKARPIVWWASVGAAFMALMIYAWTDWLLSGDAVPTPTGPTPVPTSLLISARCFEALFVCCALYTIFHFIYRPWRQGRGLTTDGMLVITWFTLWALQDPWLSYTRGWFSYNAVFVNLGCPQCHIPGWQDIGVQKHLPEPIFFMGGVYIGLFFTATVLVCKIMRMAKQRWPRLGVVGMIAIACGCMMFADTALEVIWLQFGLYAYTGAIHSLSILGGSMHQFPMYEGVLWGMVWGGCTSVRYFVDDRGRTVVERGVERLNLTAKATTVVRLLAVIGICQSIYLGYNVAFQWFGLHGDAYPQAVLDRSYLTAGMCGPGTDIACPDPRIPMPVSPDSAHIAPDGTLHSPGGLPLQTRTP